MKKVFFQYLRFGLFPLFSSLKKIKKAGFDGVEIHTVGHWNQDSVLKSIAAALDLGLEVNLHQGWSLSENPTHFITRVFDWFKLLPKNGYTLEDNLMPMAKRYPSVVYAERTGELDDNTNWWVQTSSQFKPDESYITSYEELLEAVRSKNLGVVFDTQHCLEVKLNVRGVEGLPNDKVQLYNLLERCWHDFSGHVHEIHLADSDPKLGHDLGRNVFPGEGVMPLPQFANMVKSSGWTGIITPEVSPLDIPRHHSLVELREKVREYFW